MSEHPIERCPECEVLASGQPLSRREMIQLFGAAAVAGSVGTIPAVARAAAETPAQKPAKPAEELIKELYSNLNDTQKKSIVLPWDHGPKGGIPTRMGMYNSPLPGSKIKDAYSKPQQELLNKIFRAILADEEAYTRITRGGKWDGAGSFEGIGAQIFGEPIENKKFALVFAGHHLTIRCDGNSLEGAAFGGPMYYGHSAQGYSKANVYFYQTQAVQEVFKTLTGKQAERAVVGGSPGEQAGSVKFRAPEAAKPGIPCTELTAEQKALVEIVLKSILSPYRKEDADEVMQILKANGGLDKLHLAFYKDNKMNDNERWHFWRLEGPGFVWNYRILDHVHCFVNIAATMA